MRRNKVAMFPHPSHVTRISYSPPYDEIYINCGAHDEVLGGWGRLALPCPAASKQESETTKSEK